MENATKTVINPKEYVNLADKTYRNYVKNGKYKDIIEGMVNLGGYTLRNQMLILNQCPGATKVSNMRVWNYHNCTIKKDEKGIKILSPVFDTVVTTENGKVSEKKSKYVTDYDINFVYDISQTTPKSLEESRERSIDLKAYHDVIIYALKDCLKSYNFNTSDIENDGELDTRKKTITLKQGLTKEQTLKTLINQVAAALVLGRNRDNFPGLRSEALSDITAIEISGVSSIVTKRLGLDDQVLQEPDFSKMSDAIIDKFANNIGLMRSVSKLMTSTIDNALEEIFVAEELANARGLDENEVSDFTSHSHSPAVDKKAEAVME